jgi:hypothetical protein
MIPIAVATAVIAIMVFVASAIATNTTIATINSRHHCPHYLTNQDQTRKEAGREGSSDDDAPMEAKSKPLRNSRTVQRINYAEGNRSDEDLC